MLSKRAVDAMLSRCMVATQAVFNAEFHADAGLRCRGDYTHVDRYEFDVSLRYQSDSKDPVMTHLIAARRRLALRKLRTCASLEEIVENRRSARYDEDERREWWESLNARTQAERDHLAACHPNLWIAYLDVIHGYVPELQVAYERGRALLGSFAPGALENFWRALCPAEFASAEEALRVVNADATESNIVEFINARGTSRAQRYGTGRTKRAIRTSWMGLLLGTQFTLAMRFRPF